MRTLLLSLFAIFSFTTLQAQNDKIVGIWWNKEKDSKIEVYKKGDKYFGKIIWLKKNKNDDGSTPKRDKKNPNTKLRQRTIVGTNILTNLRWDPSENEWDNGEIYDPRGGSTYSCFAKLQDKNTLFLKGFIGFALIGKSTLWARVK